MSVSAPSEDARYADGPRLLADVGTTQVRLTLESAPQCFESLAALPSDRFASLESAVRAYLQEHGHPPVRHAVFSVAVPVSDDHVQLTNHPWSFSVETLRRNLKLQTLLVVNDYTALAMGLSRLEAHEVLQVGRGEAVEGGVIGVIGAGSGLGVSGLVRFQNRAVALATEGGHVSYPAQDATEQRIVECARERFGHASAERLISGPGLELAYEVLAREAGRADTARSAIEISAAARAEPPDPVAHRALDVFCAMLGTVAGNLALTLGSLGGVYVGGGIVPQILDFFRASRFRERFEAKGRFSGWMSQVPTFVVRAPRHTLVGVSAILDDHLSVDHGAGRLLDDIKAALPNLSAAERLVAQDVLTAPRAWLTDPILQIAERCQVSTPTVMRFCRSVGFKGLPDFKLRLAAGLAGKAQLSHREVRSGDPAAERMAAVLDNSISALVAMRDRLRPEEFDRAVSKLAQARRIEIYGAGSAAVSAEDAQNKLGRLGLNAVARTDAQLQSLTAAFLSAEDVLLVLSNSGSHDPVNTAVARARKSGAVVIAMCPQRSDLARLADVVLPVDYPEDVHALVPMVSRLMQTVIVDVLVSNLALKRRAIIEQSLAQLDDQRFGVLSSHSR